MITDTITLKNGSTFELSTLGGFRLEHTQYKNITGLVKAVKELVLENCDHDINLHHSFKSAKKQKCNKCGLLVTK